jgi:uncharacterized protein YjbI with pentapeptide repeats
VLLGGFLIGPKANLGSANLHAFDLTGLDLTNSIIVSTNFSSANLTNANLQGARGPAQINGAIWSNTTCPDGTNSDAAGNTCAGHFNPYP